MLALIRTLAPSKSRLGGGYANLVRRLDDATFGRGLVSVVDQVVVSGTSFLTTVILGRACPPEQLGLYSVGFGLALALMVVPRSMIWTPFTTFTPGMDAEDRRLYSGSTLLHQVFMGGVIALVISAVGLTQLGGQAGLGKLLIILGPAVIFMFLREHIRRVCFARLQVSQALAIDVVVAAMQIGGLLLVASSGALTAVRAFAVIIVTTIPALVAWVVANRGSLAVRAGRVIPDFTRNWGFARWVLMGAILAGLGAALDPLALSLMHGNSAVGIFSAAHNMVLLANPIVISFMNFFGPHLAHVYARSGAASLRRLVIGAMFAAAVLMLGALAVLVVWGGGILSLVFGPEYAGNGQVIVALMLGEVIVVTVMPLTLGLSAAGRGRPLLMSQVVHTALSVTVGLLCIYAFGATGVGYSRTISMLGAGAYQAIAFWSLTRNV